MTAFKHDVRPLKGWKQRFMAEWQNGRKSEKQAAGGPEGTALVGLACLYWQD